MITRDDEGQLVQEHDDEEIDMTGLNNDPVGGRTSFITCIPIVDISFLDEDYIHMMLLASGYDEDVDLETGELTGCVFQQYVEWDTGWNGDVLTKNLSAYLIQNRIPENTPILLKTY